MQECWEEPRIPHQEDPQLGVEGTYTCEGGCEAEAAQRLVDASLEQLASLIGGDLYVNTRGQTVMNLGEI